MPSNRVAIVGAALSDCGRVPDKTAMSLMAQASRRAIADAGLTKDDIDGFGGHGTLLPPIEVSEYLGLRPTWVDATNVGGSSWEVMARHAAAAIACGELDVVLLTYGSTARSDVKRRTRGSAAAMSTGGAMQFEAPYGATLIAKYAMAARRHMIEYGTTVEQLAEVAVAAHEWAAMNDNAFERERITIADVAAAPMLADPFTTKHVCLRTDGGRSRTRQRGSRGELRQGAGLDSRRLGCDIAREHERVGRLHHLGRGAIRTAGLRGCRSQPGRRRRVPALRLVHLHRIADARGSRLLREGRRRQVHRIRRAATGELCPPTPTAEGSPPATQG